MGGDGGNAQEEGLASLDGIIEEAESFFGDEVSRVLAEVVDRLFLIALEGGVPVVVCVWVEQKVLSEGVSQDSHILHSAGRVQS